MKSGTNVEIWFRLDAHNSLFPQSVRYFLLSQVKDDPWNELLIVGAGVLVQASYTPVTVIHIITLVHKAIQFLRTECAINDSDEWDPDSLLRATSDARFIENPLLFPRCWVAYAILTTHAQVWYDKLSGSEQRRYRGYIFPPVDPCLLTTYLHNYLQSRSHSWINPPTRPKNNIIEPDITL